MDKSILMITFHFWRAQRKGGFHYFAEEFCKMGYNVDFVLFPYTILSLIRHRDKDRYNLKRLADLILGRTFQCGNGKLRNFGFPAFIIPPQYEKFKLHIISLISLYISFLILYPRLRRHYKFIILESNESITLLPFIRSIFPGIKIIYRQSDPIFSVTNSRFFEKCERRIIRNCDLSLFTNEMRLKYSIRNIDRYQINYKILENGININSAKNDLPKPGEYGQLKNIALYIGVAEIDWSLLFYVAEKLSHIYFFVVTPTRIPRKIKHQINDHNNIYFINGVEPDKVASFIKYCDIGIVPYKWAGLWNELLGMHAKIYQYMYAQKLIVTYNLKIEKKFFGIFESKNKPEFLNNVQEAFKLERINYEFDFNEVSWENLAKKMINYINNV